MTTATFRMRFSGRRQFPALPGGAAETLATPEIVTITPDTVELRALVLGQAGLVFAAMPSVEKVTGTATTPAARAHGSVDVTGTSGSVVPVGAIIVRDTPHARYRTTTSVELAGGAGVVDVEAVDLGAAGNAVAGVPMHFESPAAGVDAACEVSYFEIMGGVDEALLVTFACETPDAISGLDRAIGGVGWPAVVP